jgi:hypothetical protein
LSGDDGIKGVTLAASLIGNERRAPLRAEGDAGTRQAIYLAADIPEGAFGPLSRV